MFHLILTVVNTYKPLVVQLKEELGGSFVAQGSHKRNKRWRELYRWQIEGKNAEKIIKEIYDYLIIKKDRAKYALRFQARKKEITARRRKLIRDKKGRIVKAIGNLRTDEHRKFELECYKGMKRLNRRGYYEQDDL